MKQLLFKRNDSELVLAFIRVFIGFAFIYHGYGKFFNPIKWEWLGSQVPIIGEYGFIKSPLGFMAAFSEFIGGICLCLGLMSRVFYTLLSFTMLTASYYHFIKAEYLTLSLVYLIIIIALNYSGPDKYTLDSKIKVKLT